MANLLVELSPFYSSRENFSSQYTKIRDSASAADYSSLFFQDAFHSAQTAEGGACGGSRKRRRLPDELSVGNAQNAAVSDKPLPEREALSIDKKAAQKLRNRLSAQHHRERQKKFLTDIRAELELSFCIRRELEWKLGQLEQQNAGLVCQNKQLEAKISTLTYELTALRSASHSAAAAAAPEVLPDGHIPSFASSASVPPVGLGNCCSYDSLPGVPLPPSKMPPNVALGIPTAATEQQTSSSAFLSEHSSCSTVNSAAMLPTIGTATALVTDDVLHPRRSSPASPCGSESSVSTSASSSHFPTVNDTDMTKRSAAVSGCSKMHPAQPPLSVLPGVAENVDTFDSAKTYSAHFNTPLPPSLFEDALHCTLGDPAVASPPVSSTIPLFTEDSLLAETSTSFLSGAPNAAFEEPVESPTFDALCSAASFQPASAHYTRRRGASSPWSPRLNMFFLSLSLISAVLLPHFNYPFSLTPSTSLSKSKSSALLTYIATPLDVVEASPKPQELVLYGPEHSIAPTDYFQRNSGPLVRWTVTRHNSGAETLGKSSASNPTSTLDGCHGTNITEHFGHQASPPLRFFPEHSSFDVSPSSSSASPAPSQPQAKDLTSSPLAAYFRLLCPKPIVLVGSGSDLTEFLKTRNSSFRDNEQEPSKAYLREPSSHAVQQQRSYTNRQFILTLPTSALFQARFRQPLSKPTDGSVFNGIDRFSLAQESRFMWQLLQTKDAIAPFFTVAAGIRQAMTSDTKNLPVSSNDCDDCRSNISQAKENLTRSVQTSTNQQHSSEAPDATTRKPRRSSLLPQLQHDVLDEQIPFHIICDEVRWDAAYFDKLLQHLSSSAVNTS